jgi:prophage regulatory protein
MMSAKALNVRMIKTMARSNSDPSSSGSTAIAVDANRLAELLGLSIRTIRRLDSSGKLPRPLRIGGAVRWRISEVNQWVDAGCPDRAEWDRIRATSN